MTIDLHPLHGTWTVEDLDTLPETTLIEVIDGALIVNPPPTVQHALICSAVVMWLSDRMPDATVLVGAGVRLGDSGVIPDVCVVAGDPAGDTIWLDPADVDVVVEVLSPSTRDRDLGRKRDLYHDAGFTYLVVDPAARSVTVHDDHFTPDERTRRADELATRLGWARSDGL